MHLVDMLQLMSYAIFIVFIASMTMSILFPQQEKYILLAYVLISPVLLAWVAARARS